MDKGIIERNRDTLITLARSALALWPISPESQIALIHVSENATFLITAPDGGKSILRVHRPDYHDKATIASELVWMQALNASGMIATPAIIKGCDGQPIQSITIPGEPLHHMVMFAFVTGDEPDHHQPLDLLFRHLGELSAKLHRHVQDWALPEGFIRPHWDIDGIFGKIKRWGNWRDAPYLTPAMMATLEKAEAKVSQRLSAYGKSPQRYGLIHADMRLANLLVKESDYQNIHVIDFDDCGFGWFMYDFAAGISFIEDSEHIAAWKAAWLEGYQQERPLAAEDIAIMDTLVMLRRMLLLAWVGSHRDADIVADMIEDFGRVSAELAELYLLDEA